MNPRLDAIKVRARRRARLRTMDSFVEVIAIGWSLFVLLGCAALAHADARDELALAQVAWSECGVDCSSDEVAALGAVLRARCARCSIATVARLYSSRVFDVNRTDARAFLAHLRIDGDRPLRFPPSLSWSRHRDRWLALLGTAARVVRGELEHRCTQPPAHWGGIVDRARARRMRLVRVDCGATRNDFYVLGGSVVHAFSN